LTIYTFRNRKKLYGKEHGRNDNDVKVFVGFKYGIKDGIKGFIEYRHLMFTLV